MCIYSLFNSSYNYHNYLCPVDNNKTQTNRRTKKDRKNKNDNIKAIIEKSNFCQTTNNILSDIKNQLDKIDEKINNSKKEGDNQ